MVLHTRKLDRGLRILYENEVMLACIGATWSFVSLGAAFESLGIMLARLSDKNNLSVDWSVHASATQTEPISRRMFRHSLKPCSWPFVLGRFEPLSAGQSVHRQSRATPARVVLE